MAAGVMARHLATVAGVAAGVAAAVAVGVAGHSSLTLPTPFSYDVFCKTESAQNWYAWRTRGRALTRTSGGGGWGGGGGVGGPRESDNGRQEGRGDCFSCTLDWPGAGVGVSERRHGGDRG